MLIEQSCVSTVSKRARAHAGLALLELLFAFFILSFLLAGTASLVLANSHNQKQLIYKQYAHLIVEEIATRIRRSRLIAENIDVYLNIDWTQPVKNVTSCTTQECSMSQFAAYDIAQLQTMANNAIPESHIHVERCGRLLCATVYWQATSRRDACDQNQCFRLRFF